MDITEWQYFIAIVPPEPIKTELLNFKKSISTEFNTKGALRSPAHITLHMPFKFKQKKEALILNFLKEFAFKQQPFMIELNNINCFEPRVIFVDVKPNPYLNQIQKELSLSIKPALQLFNANYKAQGFHPHVTLAFRDLKKENFYKAWDKYKDYKIEYNFVCNSITLLKHNNKIWEEYKEFSFKKAMLL